jgi:UDP-N-acetylmuramate--alanine ligase
MKIYCSGIGGIGLSAYAALQKANGHQVSGSDRAQTIVTDDLEAQGIPVSFSQDGSSVPKGSDVLFVHSAAVPKDAPERKRSAEYGQRQLNYFEAVGELSHDFKNVIAVCGTHGKSSTTSMASKVLVDAGIDPTIIVGTKTEIRNQKSEIRNQNWRKGGMDTLLVEACEYRRHFLHLRPNIILMTNVDGDHFDAFESVEDYQRAFGEFLELLPEDGVVITHMEDKDCRNVVEEYRKSNIECRIIDVDTYVLPDVSVSGRHMQENAQLVLGLSDVLSLDMDRVKNSLKNYKGCWRRQELKGFYKLSPTSYKLPVIDDYAHHPREIVATISGVGQMFPQKNIVVLFQPHMHDRTLKLYDDFCTAFKGAKVFMTDVYDARHDVERESVDIKKFAEDCGGEYIGSLQEAEQYVRDTLKPNDVLIVMGAGDVTDIATNLVS